MSSLDKFLKPRAGKTLTLRPRLTSLEDGATVELDVEIQSASSVAYREGHLKMRRAIISRERPKSEQEAARRTRSDIAEFMVGITVKAEYDGEPISKDDLFTLYENNPELTEWLDGEANVDTVFIKSASKNSSNGALEDSGSGESTKEESKPVKNTGRKSKKAPNATG